MTKTLQLKRGTKNANDSYTGAIAELTYDTESKELRVHDGVTQGGKVVGGLTSVSWNDITDKPTIPSTTSQLTNDSNFINNSEATTIANNSASNAVTNHNGNSNAHSNIITPIKNVIPSAATASNQLADKKWVQSTLESFAGIIYKVKGSVATYNDLPQNAQPGDVYNVTDTGANYVYVDYADTDSSKSTDIGETVVNVSNQYALLSKFNEWGTTQNADITHLTLQKTSAEATTYTVKYYWMASDQEGEDPTEHSQTLNNISTNVLGNWGITISTFDATTVLAITRNKVGWDKLSETVDVQLPDYTTTDPIYITSSEGSISLTSADYMTLETTSEGEMNLTSSTSMNLRSTTENTYVLDSNGNEKYHRYNYGTSLEESFSGTGTSTGSNTSYQFNTYLETQDGYLNQEYTWENSDYASEGETYGNIVLSVQANEDGDNGFSPSYNIDVSTSAKSRYLHINSNTILASSPKEFDSHEVATIGYTVNKVLDTFTANQTQFVSPLVVESERYDRYNHLTFTKNSLGSVTNFQADSASNCLTGISYSNGTFTFSGVTTTDMLDYASFSLNRNGGNNLLVADFTQGLISFYGYIGDNKEFHPVIAVTGTNSSTTMYVNEHPENAIVYDSVNQVATISGWTEVTGTITSEHKIVSGQDHTYYIGTQSLVLPSESSNNTFTLSTVNEVTHNVTILYNVNGKSITSSSLTQAQLEAINSHDIDTIYVWLTDGTKSYTADSLKYWNAEHVFEGDYAIYTVNGRFSKDAEWLGSNIINGNEYHKVIKFVSSNGGSGSTDWNDITNKPTSFTPSAHTHTVSEISDFPTLATVATSGDYDDLSNKPTIPAAQVQTDWDATTGMGVILNKPSTFTPSAHNHTVTDITDFPSQTGNSGKFLTTNGTSTSWSNVSEVASQSTGTVKFWTGTQAQYDAITTKDATTLYIVIPA